MKNNLKEAQAHVGQDVHWYWNHAESDMQSILTKADNIVEEIGIIMKDEKRIEKLVKDIRRH